jgi:hypothetical protein
MSNQKTTLFTTSSLPPTAFISTATEHKTSWIDPIDINKAPQDSGVIVMWADGLVASSLGITKTTKSFDEKAHENNIGFGMNHAMNHLGELLKNKCDSYTS